MLFPRLIENKHSISSVHLMGFFQTIFTQTFGDKCITDSFLE
uniref:Uncharacterized protein n=1 Tax=Anguilla anguilla TaxID=7936 RepID=A0A0E9PZ38_ANGAN